MSHNGIISLERWCSVVEKAAADEEALMTVAIDAGADDFREEAENWEIVSSPEAFEPVRDVIKSTGVELASAEVAMLPRNYVKLVGKTARQMVKLMELLEDHDDVQHVWSNFDIEAKEIEASLA